MNILVVNRGSSSIKCYLYQLTSTSAQPVDPFWTAQLEWKNDFEEPTLSISNYKGVQIAQVVQERSLEETLTYAIKTLFNGETAVLSSADEVAIIGHRIVHGGPYFTKSVLIDANVKEKIRSLSPLAPLHNLPQLEAIERLEKLFKNTPQIAVFDTAFHSSLPEAAKIYPGPYQWYENGIQRYGFHGISFQYCFRRVSEILQEDLNSLKIVVCHLGSGASLCAIKQGKSLDTTMGFTPLEGLMMDTRSGTIDPGIILHLLETKKIDIKTLTKQLYEQSGLLGISGISSDMRDVIEKMKEGNDRATIAFEVYIDRLNRLIGSMIASLQGIDLLLFTAGIGEHAAIVRKKVCENFSFLGLKLDEEKNQQEFSEDWEISSPDSKIKVFVIHTQEAFEIARECFMAS